MSDKTTAAQMPSRTAPGGRARSLAAGLLALLITGALYLIAVRGEAILIDLAEIGAKVFCF